MSVVSLLKFVSSIFISAVFICYSPPSLSHDGHKVKDVILPDLGDLGAVEFSISCEADEKQAISKGVALLHHMMYAQAEKYFSAWIKKSPDCSMFYWGYAMSLFHPLWPDKITNEALKNGDEAIKKARSLSTDARELQYIEAANAYFDNWQSKSEKQRISEWAKSQQIVALRYSKDIDAIAFSSLSKLVTAPTSDPKFSQQKIVGKTLEKILISSPNHPGAIHYTIHAYDNPILAKLAIPAARAYDKIAPDVPHALHMPSHIFVRLGLWEDAAKWNIRSANAALKYPTNNETSMHYVHAIDYLVYSYMQTGDIEKAQQSLNDVSTHHPIQPVFPVAYALTTIPARIVLERHQWQKARVLPIRSPSYINWDKFPQVEAITYFSRGIGAIRSNNVSGAKQSLNVLESLYKKTKNSDPNYWAKIVDAQKQTLAAWINYQSGEKAIALKQMAKAADLEDSLDKNPVTPGAVLPARELLADMYMLSGEFENALTAYQACLKINPNRLNSLKGLKLAQRKLR